MGPHVKVLIERTAGCAHVIPENDTKGSMFRHKTFSLPPAGIKPPGTSSTRGECANY